MPEKLPITLITQCYNLTLSNEPGYELKLFEQLRPVVDQIVAIVQDGLDDTLDLVSPFVDGVELVKAVYHPEPYRNMLLSMVRNPWVLFLDTDMYFEQDPYAVLSECLASGDKFDKFAFVRQNMLAPDRNTPGNPWGDPVAASREGSYYLMKRDMVIGSPPLLHYPYETKTEARASQSNAVVLHRSLHYSTERWKIYYPFVVRTLRTQFADNPDVLSLINNVVNCHWGSDSTTFAKGLFEPDENGTLKPVQTVSIKDGVRVAFLGGVLRNQTWPWVNYDNAEDAHVIIQGDARMTYDPRFVERSLELFAMMPECEAVRPHILGPTPDGMTVEDMVRASTLVLAGFAGKPLGELVTATVPKHLVRGKAF